MTVAGPISVLMVIFKPLSAVLNFLSGIMTKLTGGKEDKPSVTEEELKYLVESIEEEGVLEETESDLVRSALEFDEIEAQEIITPACGYDHTGRGGQLEGSGRACKKRARFPVFRSTKAPSTISSALFMFEIFWRHRLQGTQQDIRKLLTPCLFVHKTMRLATLLEKLRKEKDAFGNRDR